MGGGQVIIQKSSQWTILGNMFGESQAKDLFCRFKKIVGV